MDINKFISLFRDALLAINKDRYFVTERGYQGKLIAELESRIKLVTLFARDAIVEQEYQKTLKKHEIYKRPDIIIHIPYEEGIYSSRSSGNYVVIQLKLRASAKKAVEDFSKLDLMFRKLDYPLGIFLNIGSDNTFSNIYSGEYAHHLHCFAVKLDNNKVLINESK